MKHEVEYNLIGKVSPPDSIRKWFARNQSTLYHGCMKNTAVLFRFLSVDYISVYSSEFSVWSLLHNTWLEGTWNQVTHWTLITDNGKDKPLSVAINLNKCVAGFVHCFFFFSSNVASCIPKVHGHHICNIWFSQ